MTETTYTEAPAVSVTSKKADSAEPEVAEPESHSEPEVKQPEVPEPKVKEPETPSEPEANKPEYSAEPEAKEPEVPTEPEVKESGVPSEPEAKEPEDPTEPEVKESGVPSEPEAKEPETAAEPEVKEPEASYEPAPQSPQSANGYGVPVAQYFGSNLEGKDPDAKPGIVLHGTSALQLAEEIAEPEEDQLLQATVTLKQLQYAKGPVLESTEPEHLAAEISNHFPGDEMIREVIAEITGPGAEVIREVISEVNAAPAEEAIQKEMELVDPNPLQTQEVVLEMTPDQIKKVIAALAPEEGAVSQDEALGEMLSEIASEESAAVEPATVEPVEQTVIETVDPVADAYDSKREVHTEIITNKEPIVIASKEPLIVVSDQPVVVVNEEPLLSNDIYDGVYGEAEKTAYITPEEFLPAGSSIDETIFLETVPETRLEGEETASSKGSVRSESSQEPAAEVEGSGDASA